MKEKDNKVTNYYYWVGKTGYVFSTSPIKPVRKGRNFKYLGYSSDIGWPKKLNTGRLLHKPK